MVLVVFHHFSHGSEGFEQCFAWVSGARKSVLGERADLFEFAEDADTIELTEVLPMWEGRVENHRKRRRFRGFSWIFINFSMGFR